MNVEAAARAFEEIVAVGWLPGLNNQAPDESTPGISRPRTNSPP